MARFDRCDVCEAHSVVEWDYNHGGWLRERPRNARLRQATSIQLSRMGFCPRRSLWDGGYEALTPNGKAIYWTLVERYGLTPGEDGAAYWAEAKAKCIVL